MKNYNKNKESSYLKNRGVNNHHGWVMSQKLPVNNFDWVKGISEFDEGFTKVIMKKGKNIFLELILNILKSCMSSIMIYHFYQKEIILKKSKNLLLIYMIKMNMLFTKEI